MCKTVPEHPFGIKGMSADRPYRPVGAGNLVRFSDLLVLRDRVGCQNPGRPIGRLFARGRPAGVSDPALAKMPSPATAGDVVVTAGGPAQRRFVNVVIPEGSVTLGSGRDERATRHGLDRVCAPHTRLGLGRDDVEPLVRGAAEF